MCRPLAKYLKYTLFSNRQNSHTQLLSFLRFRDGNSIRALTATRFAISFLYVVASTVYAAPQCDSFSAIHEI